MFFRIRTQLPCKLVDTCLIIFPVILKVLFTPVGIFIFENGIDEIWKQKPKRPDYISNFRAIKEQIGTWRENGNAIIFKSLSKSGHFVIFNGSRQNAYLIVIG